MAQFSWRQRVSWQLQAAIVSKLKSSHEAFFEVLEPYLQAAPIWLDLGCGRSVVPNWFEPRRFARACADVARAKIIVGLDRDHASLKDNELPCKVRGDANALPFRDGCFDLVTANMVVEHLEAPSEWLKEVARVLKPGGAVIFHTPNVLSPAVAAGSLVPEWIRGPLIRLVDGRSEQDVFPTRYRLNTPARVTSSARNAGLTVADLRTVCTAPITQFLGPLVLPELLMIRLMLMRPLAIVRPDIIAVLKKG